MLEIALAFVPLAVLFLSLLLGHYPGYRAIVRLSERIGRSRRTERPQAIDLPASPPPRASGGGLLIALCIAKRPPPLAA